MTLNGTQILKEIARRIKKQKGTKTITDSALAKEIGVTQPALAGYRGEMITAKQVVNLMEKYAKNAENRLIENAVTPIVEFFPLKPVETSQGVTSKIFSEKDEYGVVHPYSDGLKKRLQNANGIYIFHDSRGRAIYTGKAQRQSLWTEMNLAFNRDRREVQSIKRVEHPTSRVEYKGHDEKKRRIAKDAVSLYHIATYASAYEVPDGLIGKFEALIIRSFANDLLNVRMEAF